MSITNQSKPITTLSNSTKVNIGEIWGSDLLQWQNELRTWAETVSIIDNATKITSSISNINKPA